MREVLEQGIRDRGRIQPVVVVPAEDGLVDLRGLLREVEAALGGENMPCLVDEMSKMKLKKVDYW